MKPDVNVRYAHRWIYMVSEPIDYSRVKFFKIAVDTVGAAKEKNSHVKSFVAVFRYMERNELIFLLSRYFIY